MPTTKQNTDKIQSIDGRIHDFELAIDQLQRLEKEQQVCPYNLQHNVNVSETSLGRGCQRVKDVHALEMDLPATSVLPGIFFSHKS
jgi:hypothetical protein